MKTKRTVLMAGLAMALVGCGGGGGGNIRATGPDASEVNAGIDASGWDSSPGFIAVVEGGVPEFEDATTFPDSNPTGQLSLRLATARGGMKHYTGTGRVDGVDIRAYGAWGEHQAFHVFGLDNRFVGWSDGRFSGANPRGVSGTATWRGAMVGERSDKFIRGDSEVVYDFADATVDVSLTNIRDMNTPQAHSPLHWRNLRVTNGAFSDRYSIAGSFYGPNHEEVGGVFDRSSMTGAFGAKRQ